MADITQRLGFDVTQGVNALNSLKSTVDNLTASLLKLNSVKLGNVGRSINTFTKNLDKVPGSANNAVASIQKLGQSVGLSGASQNVGKLDTQLTTLGNTAARVGNQVRTTIGGAFIFSKANAGLRAIRQLLLDASESAREFQLSVAEVQTIAGGATFDELATSIRGVAIEFGRTEADTAAAAYQAFSNQVVQTTGELEAFLPAAERLAIATGSTTQDAVNALSSVLNTFGESAGSLTSIADVLFKTVEEGRTTFPEFANSLGTINSIAKEAGVSFAEVQTGIADITKTGTTTSVALTQLRGVFTKLVKPTDKLRAAFREFGAKDGPSFVRASGGLFQALQKLQQFSDRSGISIVELFGRVRGGQGALNILRDEGESFINTLGELEEAAGSSGEVVSEAFAKIAETDAQKANVAFGELTVRMTELGEAVLPVLVKFAELFNKVIPDARSLGILIAGATVALGLLAAAGAIAVLSLTGIGVFLLPIAPALIVIAAATFGVITALNLQNEAIEKGIELRTQESRAAKEAADAQVKEQTQVIAAIEDNIKIVDSIIEDFFGDQIQDLKAFNQASVESFNGVIEAFADSRKNILKQIESAIKNADKVINDSNKRARSALQELADIKFDESTKGLTNAARVTKELERASRTAALAREQFANAGQDAEKRREALETRVLAKEQLRDAERSASKSQQTFDDKKVADARKKFLQDIVNDEANLSEETQKFQDDARAKIDDVTRAFEEQGKKVVFVAGEVTKLLSIYDEFGNIKTDVQILTDLQAAVPLARELRGLLSADFTGGLAEQVGVDPRQGIDAALAGVLEFETRSAESILSAQNIIESHPFRVKVGQLDRLEDAKLELDPKQVTAEFANLKLQLDADLAALNSELILTPKMDPAGVVTGAFRTLGRDFTSVVTGAEAAFLGSLRGITEGAGEFTQQQITEARNQISKIQTELGRAIVEGDISKAAKEAIQADIETSKSVLDSATDLLKQEGDAVSSSVSDVNQKVGEAVIKTTTLATETGKVATASGTVKSNTAALAGQIAAAVGPATRLANELERAARARATAGSTAFFGKTIHRQTGGFTRGQDRILTSTAPGEVVINANAARPIRSELQAINAQQTPQFRETGGAVTNVGDINVNISTQDPGNIEGRSIARDLKRELRTRTSSI